MRKPRYTIFLGYGQEAESLLKLFEQVKCRTGISTNIPFIKLLLTFFEKSFNNEDNDLETTQQDRRQSSLREKNSNTDLHVSENVCKDPTIQQQQLFSSVAVAQVNATESQLEKKTFHQNDCLGNVIVDKPSDCLETVKTTTLRKKKKTPSSNLDEDDNVSRRITPFISSYKDCCHSERENISVVSGAFHSDHQIVDQLSIKDNIVTESMACTVAKSICTSFDAISSTEPTINKVSEVNRADEPGPSFPPKMMKIDDISLSHVVGEEKEDNNYPDEIRQEKEINRTPLHVINKYMEHAKKELDYYHGFISSGSKLREFLEEYRKVTNMVFTVRSSRSYIKKRTAINSTVTYQENQNLEDTNMVAAETCEKHSSASNDSNNMTQEQLDISNTSIEENRDRSTNKSLKDKSSFSKTEDYTIMDSIMTGPLRWEYDFGMPPIPFTGIPFCIIGNTHYKCFYACPDSRTLRKRKLTEDDQTLETGVKKRTRRSLKRDCKAMMCIKSIVCFPEFTVKDSIQKISSKKGCRKLKATALNQVRDAFSNGEAVGHPAFWLHVPLPEAHTTHDLVHQSAEETLKDQPLTDGMDAISHILNVAAQYGGKVQILNKCVESVLKFHLDNSPSEEGIGSSTNNDDVIMSSQNTDINNASKAS